jgi:metal-sulfur cluster biosynthetic enzyme
MMNTNSNMETTDNTQNQDFPQIDNQTSLDAQAVVDVLKTIFDPEIDFSIYDIGLIYKITIKDDSLVILMTLTTVNCPEAQTLPDTVLYRLSDAFPEFKVEVDLTFEPEWTVANMSEEVQLKLGLY